MGGVTPRGFPYPSGPDAAVVASDIQALAAAIDTNITTALGGPQTFNVLNYGATGLGIVDDTVGCQAAYNAAAAYATSVAPSGGAVVVFPPGSYQINQSVALTCKANVSTYAVGAYIWKGGVPSVGILHNFLNSDTFNGYNGNNNITVIGGIWDGKGQNAAGSAEYDIMEFIHCQNIMVIGAEFRNAASAHGLEFNSTNIGIATNCKFYGFRDTTGGSRVFSEAIQIDVAVSGSSSIGNFDGTHCQNIIVTGCYMGPAIDGSGLGSYGKLVGSHTTSTGQHYNNITVVGNIVNTPIDVGIQAYNWVNSTIANNVVTNGGNHCIVVTSPDPVAAGFSVLSSGVAVTGNTLGPTTAGVGIEVLGYTSTAGVTDCVVDGNIIRSTTSSGIFCQVAFNAVVSNNIIDVPGSNGVNITACQFAMVSSNTIRNPGTNYCIFFGQITSPSTVNATDGNCSDNMCLVGATATAGIRLSTGTTLILVQGNTVRKNGSAGVTAVSCAGGVGTTNTVTGNDLTGYGSNANTILVSSGTINKTIANDANVGTNLF